MLGAVCYHEVYARLTLIGRDRPELSEAQLRTQFVWCGRLARCRVGILPALGMRRGYAGEYQGVAGAGPARSI